MNDKNISENSSREMALQAAMFRLGNVGNEIQAGYEIIKKFPKTITVFGSARVSEDSIHYQQAREVSKQLAQLGFTIVTGGGGGIMEAANRGAMEGGGNSIGFNIKLPKEQSLNDYTTDSMAFSHFAPRKIVMTMMAHAYIYFPGGFGTLDEFAEIITLCQTHSINRVPVILYDNNFWGELDIFIRKNMLETEQMISPGDENIYTMTEDIDEIVKLVQASENANKN